MLAKQLMSQPVSSCHVNDNLAHAASLMWSSDCGAIPIVDDAGRVVAMLTDRDICMAAYTQGKPLCDINMRTAMSQSLQTCSGEASLESLEQLMMQHQIRRIPVVDAERRPIGILSINDLVRAANKQHPAAHGASNGISLNAAARTLAAVCATRQPETGPRIA